MQSEQRKSKYLSDKESCIWKEPAMEIYYLVNRWKTQGKTDFLDVGCGVGRHSYLFAKSGFRVRCLDICEESVSIVNKRAEQENINIECSVGDFVTLPYEDESVDCILSYNVISHVDKVGMQQAIRESYRVLKNGGEWYLTLCSKKSWGYLQDWQQVDENTKLRMQEGAEYRVPHFFVDYTDIHELFAEFAVLSVKHVEEFREKNGKTISDFSYHVLVKKI